VEATSKRRKRIAGLLESKGIGTQNGLLAELRRVGERVTQGTLSRDLREMGVTKWVDAEGLQRYVLPASLNTLPRAVNLEREFLNFVLGFKHTGNLLLVKTTPGTASAVASTLDHLSWEEILGTVAGDDTILVVLRKAEDVQAVLKRFDKLQKR
jgi:transcriptional regulator of arginine metabolism